MSFNPLVIDDLGAKLYSTLPPVIAELIANGYDACASRVNLDFIEGDKKKIIVYDDGLGMSYEEINDKYLRIGRKKRINDEQSKCGRLSIGKKGIGKLAFFGIAGCAEIETVHEGKGVRFEMDWDKIEGSSGDYEPAFAILENPSISKGTKITLTKIFKKSDFDIDSIKKSISNYFVFDETFRVYIRKNPSEEYTEIDNELRYVQKGRLEEFSWSFPEFGIERMGEEFDFVKDIKGKIILFDKPVRSDIRGVTLFSRRKLVNLAEFFPVQGSSYFYQYLSGWLEVDFVDDFVPDVISTNRSSLNWNDEKLTELKRFLKRVISLIHGEWRERKKKKTEETVNRRLGVSVTEWKESNKNNPTITKNIEKLSSVLDDPEKTESDCVEKFADMIYELAPKYADFILWKNLNARITGNGYIREHFFEGKYLEAAREAVQIYNEEIQDITSSTEDGCKLMDLAFKYASGSLIDITDKSNPSEQNIDLGQQYLSKGVITGFRNPGLGHTSITKGLQVKYFDEKNCLDILSLLSYLFDRIDHRKRPPIATK